MALVHIHYDIFCDMFLGTKDKGSAWSFSVLAVISLLFLNPSLNELNQDIFAEFNPDQSWTLGKNIP